MQKTKNPNRWGFSHEKTGKAKCLDGATNLVGADAAGANADTFVLTVRQNHFAFLQVGVLEETVVLVGEADFIRFVATLIADFTYACHWV